MKKNISIVVASLLLTSSLFGVDLSKETSQDVSIKTDKSMAGKNTKSKTKSTKGATSTKSGFDKSANVEVDFYQYLISNPKVNQCIFFEKTMNDFGVSSFQDGEYIDVTLQEIYENLAKANASVETVKMNVSDFKNYLKCIGKEGANFAQTITNFGTKLKRQDEISSSDLRASILKEYDFASGNLNGNVEIIYLNFLRTLETNDCIFFGELGKIKCGGVAFSFPDNSLKYGETTLTSPQNFYGVTGKMTVAINTNIEKSNETSSESQTASNNEITVTKTKSVNKTKSNKKSLAIGGFVPKD